MSLGKNICTQLKNVRLAIAKANDIEYTPSVCTYKGECIGICPACEAELKYLTEKLEEKEKKGELVHIKNIGNNLVKKIESKEENSLQFSPAASEDNRQQEIFLENQAKRKNRYEKMIANLTSSMDKADDMERQIIEADIATIKSIITNF